MAREHVYLVKIVITTEIKDEIIVTPRMFVDLLPHYFKLERFMTGKKNQLSMSDLQVLQYHSFVRASLPTHTQKICRLSNNYVVFATRTVDWTGLERKIRSFC